MTDGLTVPADDDVALLHPRLGSWPLWLNVHHHYTPSAALDGDKLEAEAEIAPRDVPVLLKPRCDTLNSSRRDNEDSPARSKYCHPDRSARRIKGETTFGTPPHAQIKFDPSIDLTAA